VHRKRSAKIALAAAQNPETIEIGTDARLVPDGSANGESLLVSSTRTRHIATLRQHSGGFV
jgi:hypothetical protein